MRLDESSFESVVREHGARMLAVARRLMKDETDAADAVQDAFLAAWKGIDRFEASAQISTWLHRITVNACLMRLRAQRCRPERAIGGMLPQFLEDGHPRDTPRTWSEPPADPLEREELRLTVRQKIDELPDSYRAVLLLRDIEGMSTEDVARSMRTTRNAVKIRLHRARQALKSLLDPIFASDDVESRARYLT